MSKEFSFTRSDFNKVRALVYDAAGINLGDHKFEMVYGRLARRLRQTGIKKVSDYINYLDSNTDESVQFINALTTNLTSFFRENHHFEFLRKTGIPELLERHKHDKRVRIWSAGCSTGEEPYSIAWSIKELCKKRSNWDVKVLATDLDTDVLDRARGGNYDATRVEKVDTDVQRKLFNRNGNGIYSVKDEFKRNVFFKQLNLMAPWPMKGAFDIIFCRNVLIYFKRDTQQSLISRFYEKLTPGGYLILGHSESIGEQVSKFKPIGRTVFRKI